VLTTQYLLSAKVGTNFAGQGSRSVGIVPSRTQTTVFGFFFFFEAKRLVVRFRSTGILKIKGQREKQGPGGEPPRGKDALK
jgi:hypothetical protein